jgi:HTH-type transcriptional regulator/antitoxin HigA
MHELAHVVAGHRGSFLDTIYGREEEVVGRELEADCMAQNWLLEPGAYRSFVRRAKPYFSGKAIRDFAASQGRHPGIVLGRLQFDGFVGFEHLRSLLVGVRPILEGWIDRPIAA